MMENRLSLAGQVAVITGLGRGIGPAVAAELRRLGATIVAVDLAFEDEGWVSTGSLDSPDLGMQIDISNPFSVARMCQEVTDQYGLPSLLVNGASLSPVASVPETEPEQWDRVMAVNLRGPFLVCRAFLPGMLKRGSGTIVNVVPADAMPYLPAYAASSQGLAGFTHSLAAEVAGSGVNVIAFAASLADTAALRQAAHDLAPRLGMDYEQLLAMAEPAERQAQALAHLVVQFAAEYHGETVDAKAILERVAGEPIPTPPPPALPTDRRSREELLRQAQRLTGRLQAVLEQTDVELGRLPLLARRTARRGFTSTTGRDPVYWSRALVDLQGHLRQMDRLGGASIAAFRAEYPGLADGLAKLRRYYAEAPDEFARFTRDPAALDHITEQSAERVALIESLLALLERLKG